MRITLNCVSSYRNRVSECIVDVNLWSVKKKVIPIHQIFPSVLSVRTRSFRFNGTPSLSVSLCLCLRGAPRKKVSFSKNTNTEKIFEPAVVVGSRQPMKLNIMAENRVIPTEYERAKS